MRTHFCGREAELATLLAAYERAAVTRTGPELIVVAAEAGLGKTRLVQELYNRLSVTHDGVGGAGYWPDDLGQIENNLKVNPSPSECNDVHPLPFLWWGVRLDDPGERNAPVAGAVPSALAFLRPHLEPMYRARQAADRQASTARILGRGAIDALIDFIPGGGLIKTGAETAYDLFVNQRQDERTLSLRETDQRERRSQNDMILDALGQLMAPDSNPLPAVILFDDGQFSPADTGAVELFDRLVERAASHRWPVLILVTHWIGHWHAQQTAAEASIARVITKRARQLAVGWLELRPVPDLGPMMSAALPGLSAEHKGALVERAGGNPRYLEQIIALAKGRPRYFAARDVESTLTRDGFAELSRATVDMQHTIEQRLLDAGPDVRRAVSLASLQGVRFSCSMTREVADALGHPATDVALEAAERPHAFVSGVERGVAEFAQRAFQEVARGALADVADPDEAEFALADVLRRRVPIGSDTTYPTYDEAEHTLTAAAAMFEYADAPQDRTRCAIALFNLVHHESEAHRYANAVGYAERLWQGIVDGRWQPAAVGVGACLQVGSLMMTVGRLPQAGDILRRCVHLARDAFQRAPTHENKWQLAYALSALGDIYVLAGDLAGGSPAQAAEAFDLASRLSASIDNELATVNTRRALGWSLNKLGDVVSINEGPKAALAVYERAHDVLAEVAAGETDDQPQIDLAAALLRLGEAHMAIDGPQSARDYIVRSHDIIAAYAARHETVASRANLASSTIRMGDFLIALEGVEPALQRYREALEIYESIAAEVGTPDALRNVSLAIEKLGDATDDMPARRGYYEDCLRIKHDLIALQPTRRARRDKAVMLKKLGLVDYNTGAYADAKVRYTECLEIGLRLEKELASIESARDLAEVRLLLVLLYCDMEDEAGAETGLVEALAATEVYRARNPGPDADARMATIRTLKETLESGHEPAVSDMLLTMARGDRTVALTTCRRTLAQLRTQLAENHSPETEELVGQYEVAVRELEDAVARPLH